MSVCPADLDPIELYRLMTGVVVPRPIAWITTLSEGGAVNLAPFSCYSFLSSNPPILGVTIGKRRGALKDTAANIHRTSEFVVHTADEALVRQLHRSADEFAHEVSEAELTGLATVACESVSVPRVSAAPVAMECRLLQILQFGTGGSEFVVGEVQRFHIRDGLYRNGKIDSDELRPLGRLAGPNYIGLHGVYRMTPNLAMTPGEVI